MPQQPLRPQQLYEHAPARERIGEVMQHSDGLDQIEGSSDRVEAQNVGLANIRYWRGRARAFFFAGA